MERCLLCVRVRCAVDLETGHVVLCSRTMCRQCFTDSQRVVQLENERVLCCVRHVFFFGGKGNVWNGLDFARGSGIEDRDVISRHHLFCRGKGIGDAAGGCGGGGGWM